MPDTERLYATLISMLSDGAAAHSTNRQLIRDLLKSVHLYPTLTGEVGVISERFPYGDTRRHGSVGNGSTNDTTAFQNAVDSLRVLGGGIVNVPNTGLPHMVGAVFVGEGIEINLNGGEVRMLASQVDFTRVFNTIVTGNALYNYTGTNDSKLLIIRNGIISGNRTNQGTYTGYEKEHHACVALGAQSASTGKLRVHLEDLELVDSAGDGLQLGYNVSLSFRNLRCRDNFRGGFTVSGGGHIINGEKYRSTGTTHDFGINWEPTATPGTAIYARIDDAIVGKGVQIELSNCPGSDVEINRLIMTDRSTTGGGFVVTAQDSTTRIRFTNSTLCTLVGGTASDRFNDVGELSFHDCKLICLKDASATIGYCSYWFTTNGFGPQSIVYERCKFIAVGWAGSDVIHGFRSTQTLNANVNSVKYIDCEWDSSLDIVHWIRGGKVTFVNPTINCLQFLKTEGALGTDDNVVIINGWNSVDGITFCTQGASNVPISFAFERVLFNGGNGTAGSGTISAWGFSGFTNVTIARGAIESTISITTAPVMGGLKGMIARTSVPAASTANSWVAVINSLSNAAYKTQSTLGA